MMTDMHIPIYTPPPVRAILSISGGGEPKKGWRKIKTEKIEGGGWVCTQGPSYPVRTSA